MLVEHFLSDLIYFATGLLAAEEIEKAHGVAQCRKSARQYTAGGQTSLKSALLNLRNESGHGEPRTILGRETLTLEPHPERLRFRYALVVFHDPQRDIEAGAVTIGCIFTFNPKNNSNTRSRCWASIPIPLSKSIRQKPVMATDFDAWNGAVELGRCR